jgi:hypothetical protein
MGDSNGSSLPQSVLPVPDDDFDAEHIYAVLHVCAVILNRCDAGNFNITDFPGMVEGGSPVKRARLWIQNFVFSQLRREGDPPPVELLGHVLCSYCRDEYRAGRMTYKEYVDCCTKPHSCG